MNYKYYTAAGLIVLAFASGRFLTPVKIETKTVEVEKKQTETEREKHKDTTTVVTEKPDGTKVTETHSTEQTNTRRATTSDAETTTTSAKTYGSSKTAVAALMGYPISGGVPTFGLAVSRQFLGPLTAGAWGLTNGTIGVSLGLEF